MTTTRNDLIRQRDHLDEQIRTLLAKRGDAALAIAESGSKSAGKELAQLDQDRHALAMQRDALSAAIEAFDRRASHHARLAEADRLESLTLTVDATVESLIAARRKAMGALNDWIAARAALVLAEETAAGEIESALALTIGVERMLDVAPLRVVDQIDGLRVTAEQGGAITGDEFAEAHLRQYATRVRDAVGRKVDELRAAPTPVAA